MKELYNCTEKYCLEKITKKRFIDALCGFKSVFISSAFRKDDAFIVNAIEKIQKQAVIGSKSRFVKNIKSNSIVFSDNSALYLDQTGKHDYYKYVAENGLYYVIQRLEYFDNFDNIYNYNYVIYCIINQ